MGPARDRMRANSSRKSTFFVPHSFMKIVVYDINTASFYSVNVFFRFLAEIRFRTIMKLPQKASFVTEMYSFGTSITLPTGQPHYPARLGNSKGRQGDYLV